MQLVGGNMFKLFTDENFLGVIVLGAGFGVGKSYSSMNQQEKNASYLSSFSNYFFFAALVQLSNEMPPDVNWDMILTIQVIEEVLQVFMKFVMWIVKCTPFAIISLSAAAIGAQTN